jgi:protein-S-isoprenylcysteine O-methyltransferase Ste14
MNGIDVSNGNRILLSRMFAMAIFALVFVSLNAWQHAAPMIEHSLSLMGWVLVGIGVTGRIWCSIYISGHKNIKLVVDGPYSICRNPLYVSSFIGGLGVMLITETLLLPALFTLVFWAYYPPVVADEERTLLSRHGDAFEAYRSRVPRFWPKFSLLSEPASYVVSTALLRKHLSETVWFVIAEALSSSSRACTSPAICRYLCTSTRRARYSFRDLLFAAVSCSLNIPFQLIRSSRALRAERSVGLAGKRRETCALSRHRRHGEPGYAGDELRCTRHGQWHRQVDLQHSGRSVVDGHLANVWLWAGRVAHCGGNAGVDAAAHQLNRHASFRSRAADAGLSRYVLVWVDSRRCAFPQGNSTIPPSANRSGKQTKPQRMLPHTLTRR